MANTKGIDPEVIERERKVLEARLLGLPWETIAKEVGYASAGAAYNAYSRALVRTLRELIERYYEIIGNRTDNIKDVIKYVIDTYNDNNHRSLSNKTPNEAFNDLPFQMAKNVNDSTHNNSIYNSTPFKSGDKVRILEDKGKFDKGKKKLSKEIYTVDDKQGYKLKVDGLSRKLKPSELLKVEKVSNPIKEEYIKEKQKEKKQGKIINSLVKNEEMTVEQAKSAVKNVNETLPKRQAKPIQRYKP